MNELSPVGGPQSGLCPVHCVNLGCPQPNWLEAHETFVLTVIGIGGSGLGVLLAYFLKSRCSNIKVCWGLFSCVRTPPVDPSSVIVETLN